MYGTRVSVTLYQKYVNLLSAVKVTFRFVLMDRLLLSLLRAVSPCRPPLDLLYCVCRNYCCVASAVSRRHHHFLRATSLFLICWVHFLTRSIDHWVSAMPALSPCIGFRLFLWHVLGYETLICATGLIHDIWFCFKNRDGIFHSILKFVTLSLRQDSSDMAFLGFLKTLLFK